MQSNIHLDKRLLLKQRTDFHVNDFSTFYYFFLIWEGSLLLWEEIGLRVIKPRFQSHVS